MLTKQAVALRQTAQLLEVIALRQVQPGSLEGLPRHQAWSSMALGQVVSSHLKQRCPQGHPRACCRSHRQCCGPLLLLVVVLLLPYKPRAAPVLLVLL